MFQAVLEMGQRLSALEVEARFRLEEVSIAEIAESGVNAVLLDLDNTVAAIGDWTPTREARRFVEEAKKHNLRVVLLSNVVFPWRERRVRAIADELEVSAVCAYWPQIKPRTEPFVRALELAGASAEETVVIGDQLIADMLGAQRLGIHCIWVKAVGGDHPLLWMISLLEWLCCRTLGCS